MRLMPCLSSTSISTNKCVRMFYEILILGLRRGKMARVSICNKKRMVAIIIAMLVVASVSLDDSEDDVVGWAILGRTKRARSWDGKIAPMIRHEIILQIGRWPNTGPNKYKDSITIKDNLFTASTTIFFNDTFFCWGSAGFWKWHDPFHIVPHEKILWSTSLNVCVKNNDRKWQPAPNWWQDVSTSQKKYRP